MNLIQKISQTPKRFVVMAALLVASVATAATFAWGPSRTTYTIENPADHVVFNSITNNPEYGDEREFLTVRDLTTGETLGGSTKIVPGHEYLFQVYVHNNAASNFNSAQHNYKGIARNTVAEVALPNKVNGTADAAAYVRASNASPVEVWDTVRLTSTGNVDLDYQEGTARLFTNHFKTGTPLSDALVSESGVKIGYSALDGNWPGCLQYSGTVTFRVKAKAPDFSVAKTVRVNGATDTTFKESVSVKPSDKVDFQVYFKNTGSTTLSNVVIRDQLPTGMTYVAGSTWLHNVNGTRQVADGITTNGLNIGGYAPNGDAYIKFTAQVASNDKLPVCNVNTLKNVASAQPEGQNPKSDDAIVTVPKTCVEKNIEVCRLSDKKIVTIKESEFDSSKHSKNLNDCKVTEEGKIKVCRLEDKQIVTIKESEFDSSKYSKDLNDCKEKPVVPETPEEIPSTGPAEVLASIVGSGAVGYGAYAYAASRRALKNVR